MNEPELKKINKKELQYKTEKAVQHECVCIVDWLVNKSYLKTALLRVAYVVYFDLMTLILTQCAFLKFFRKLAVFDTWSRLVVHVAMDNTVVIEEISE